MCVRRKATNLKLNQPAFAQPTGLVDLNNPNRINSVQGASQLGNQPQKGSKEKAQEKQPPLVSPEQGRKRRDDDTLREVGNEMPEYDCDRDDPQPIRHPDKTQDVSLKKEARSVSATQEVA
ncbi:hypothetical protein Q1695_002607 [Nippostrongylus brasiliensis]|nr:hypothetical protein Q1695_002607 [Nippostrongylus brasiliensis]